MGAPQFKPFYIWGQFSDEANLRSSSYYSGLYLYKSYNADPVEINMILVKTMEDYTHSEYTTKAVKGDWVETQLERSWFDRLLARPAQIRRYRKPSVETKERTSETLLRRLTMLDGSIYFVEEASEIHEEG